MREWLLGKHPAEREDTVAIKLVLQAPAPDGVGAVSNWVQRACEGDRAVFSRWTARRTALGRYDVRYICFLVDRDGKAQPIGYSWSADLALQLVHGPRMLTEDELRADWSGKLRQPDSARVINRPIAP